MLLHIQNGPAGLEEDGQTAPVHGLDHNLHDKKVPSINQKQRFFKTSAKAAAYQTGSLLHFTTISSSIVQLKLTNQSPPYAVLSKVGLHQRGLHNPIRTLAYHLLTLFT